MEDQNLESLILFHKALSDGTRLRIVNLLMEGACCVTEMARALGISQSRVSQHLNILRHAGMVRVTRKGTSRRYSLDTDRFPPELFECVRRAREGSPLLLGDIKRLRG
jgi:DNA-binding transcriptional ArsR family regulator